MFRRLRYRKWLVAGVGLATLAVPTAALAGNSQSSRLGATDGWYPHAVSPTQQSRSQVLDGRSPDTVDAALAVHPKLDPMIVAYLERYGYSRQQIDAMARPAPAPQVQTPVDGRSPDTTDFAVQAHAPVVTITRDPGFQWGDFGIGLGAAMVGLSLLAITRLFSKREGHRPVTSS